MDVLNFISWIKRKDYRAIVPANAVTVVGVPDPTRDDKYLSIVVPVSSLVTGASGTFTAGTKTVTVVDGVITSIV
jgi:hypothetical protein